MKVALINNQLCGSLNSESTRLVFVLLIAYPIETLLLFAKLALTITPTGIGSKLIINT